MAADRERPYDATAGRPAQNGDAPFRSRWSENMITEVPRGTGRSRRHESRQIDVAPLVRLAAEACWARLLNGPRPACPVDRA